MKKIIFILLAGFYVKSAYCQFDFPEQKESMELKDRTLLVELKEEDPKTIKKLSKVPADLEAYKNEIKAYNEMMQKYFPAYWNLNNTIEYKTTSEIDALFEKQPKPKYAVFNSGWTQKQQQTHNNVKTLYDVYSFKIYLQEDAKKRNNYPKAKGCFFSVSLRSDEISPGDLVFIIHQFNNFISTSASGGKKSDLFNIESNLETLKNKTLLLDKNTLDIDEGKISAAYPNSFKVVTNLEIEQAIIDKNKEDVYISFVWSDKKNCYLYVVADAENGKLLSRMGEGGFNISIINPNSNVPTQPLMSYRSGFAIKASHLKVITNKFAQKIN